MITERWPEVPIKSLVDLNPETLPESFPSDVEINYVEISDVSEFKGVLFNEPVRFGDAPSRARRPFRIGDVLISTVRTYLRAVAGVREAPPRAVASTGFAVLRPRRVEPRFLAYAMLNTEVLDEVVARSVGVSYPAINASDLVAIKIKTPDRETQSKVADFLDRETAEIDAFIADQEELIRLLTERRDAGWQAAVDALESHEVPLRRVIDSIVDGPFGSGLTSAHYSDSGARVVRLGNIGINEFKDADRAFISLDYFAELSNHSVRQGDVVVAGLGDDRMPLGRATVVPDIVPAIVKADCYRLRPGPLVTAHYLAWVLSAPQSRMRMRELSRGSTRQRLNTSVVRDVMIPLPSIADQERAVAEAKESDTELAAAIEDAREAIALSRERRAALISAAVTGKIDVREHATSRS